MYEKMFADMKTNMKPLMDLAETNKKTLETLAALQSECMQGTVSASVAQLKALSECKEPKSAVELQVKFYKEMEAKLTDTTKKGVQALTEAREAASKTLEGMAKTMTAEMAKAVKK